VTSTVGRALVAAERAASDAVVRVVDRPEVANAIFDAGSLAMSALAQVNRVRNGVWHWVSLPSHRDVKLLSVQLARLDVALAEVQQRLDEMSDRA
jgi:hypothetical protein